MSMKAINSAAKALNQYIDSVLEYLKANAFPILALLGAYYVYKNYCTYRHYYILNFPGLMILFFVSVKDLFLHLLV
jgi:hypothetical protein